MALPDVLASVSDVLSRRIVTIGNTPVTLASIVGFILVMAVFVLVARLFARIISRWAFGRLADEGSSYALARVVQYAILGLGLVIAIQLLGIDLGSIAILLGALGVGIGLGLQAFTSNFASGLILLFERPIKVGDRVTVGDTEGDVVEIGFRATIVRSVTNRAVIVPNSLFMTETVVNLSHSDPRLLLMVEVGVSYGSDLEKVLRCLREVAEEHPEVLADPPPGVRLASFGESAWNMKLLGWIDDAKEHLRIQADLNEGIVRKFRANNIEIPFPQRDLHWRSPLPMPIA